MPGRFRVPAWPQCVLDEALMKTLHLALRGAAFGSVSTSVSQMDGHRAVALEETFSIGPLMGLETP